MKASTSCKWPTYPDEPERDFGAALNDMLILLVTKSTVQENLQHADITKEILLESTRF